MKRINDEPRSLFDDPVYDHDFTGVEAGVDADLESDDGLSAARKRVRRKRAADEKPLQLSAARGT